MMSSTLADASEVAAAVAAAAVIGAGLAVSRASLASRAFFSSSKNLLALGLAATPAISPKRSLLVLSLSELIAFLISLNCALAP